MTGICFGFFAVIVCGVGLLYILGVNAPEEKTEWDFWEEEEQDIVGHPWLNKDEDDDY